MKKSYVYVAVLSLLFFAGAYLRMAFPGEIEKEFRLFSAVKGCAETDSGMSERSHSSNLLILETNNKNIVYSRTLSHLCCRQARIEHEVQGNLIFIYEIWRGPGCRCQCSSTLSAVISDVPEGTYEVKVYEKATEPVSGAITQTLITTDILDIQLS